MIAALLKKLTRVLSYCVCAVPLVASSAHAEADSLKVDCAKQARLSATTNYLSAHSELLKLYGPTYNRVIRELNRASARLTDRGRRVLDDYSEIERRMAHNRLRGDSDSDEDRKAYAILKRKRDAVLKKVMVPFTRDPRNPHSDVRVVMLFEDSDNDEIRLVSCIRNDHVSFDTKQVSGKSDGFKICMEKRVRSDMMPSLNPVRDIVGCEVSQGAIVPGGLFRGVDLCMTEDEWVTRQVEKSCSLSRDSSRGSEVDAPVKDLDGALDAVPASFDAGSLPSGRSVQ